MNAPPFSRRALLQTGLVLGFGLKSGHVFALSNPLFDPSDEAPNLPGSFEPNGFIQIAPTGQITLIAPGIEMGQGAHTSSAMLVAEELEVDLLQIHVVDAPPNQKVYGNPLLGGLQQTGGSTSTRAFWKPLRQAGAAAREMLIAAAAQIWDVAPDQCVAAHGEVRHGASQRVLAYGQLAAEASKQPVPPDPKLKPASAFTLIGKSLHRLDTPAKANGSAIYGIDVKVPGMKIASLMVCPIHGGKLVGFKEKNVRAMPGVIDIFHTENSVAVVGENFWAANQALLALEIEWAPGPAGLFDDAELWNDLRQAAQKNQALVAVRRGDPEGQEKAAAQRVVAEYQSPFLAHAAMEPLNCTVSVRPDACELWLGTQAPVNCRDIAAKITGLKPEQVILHPHLIGSAFGRRLFSEFVGDAVRIAQQAKYPVKVIWSREQDLAQDTYRPGYYDRFSAGLDQQGEIVSFSHHIYAGSVMAAAFGSLPADKMDKNAVEGAAELLYAYPNYLVDWTRLDPPVQIGWFRGVGPLHNTFVNESFMDELAYAAKVDPLQFRRNLLQKSPRALKVLDLLEEKSGWTQKMAPPFGRGLSFHSSFGSFMATALEVHVSPQGQVRLKRAVVAVDCGQKINPNTLNAQIEGGLIFGLSTALYSEVNFDKGRTRQSNFNNYRVLRLNEAPAVEIYSIESAEEPGGIGEAATVAAPAALGNAIFAATGVRLRRLPVDSVALKKTPG